MKVAGLSVLIELNGCSEYESFNCLTVERCRAGVEHGLGEGEI